jgi:hypothetical protein
MQSGGNPDYHPATQRMTRLPVLRPLKSSPIIINIYISYRFSLISMIRYNRLPGLLRMRCRSHRLKMRNSTISDFRGIAVAAGPVKFLDININATNNPHTWSSIEP